MGTPHLLLGLIADDGSTPAKALEAMGFSVSEVRTQVARKVGTTTGKPRRRRPDYSSRAEAILSRALSEAAGDGRSVVEPKDLLVAIVTEPGGRAAGVLNSLREGREASGGTDGRVPVSF